MKKKVFKIIRIISICIIFSCIVSFISNNSAHAAESDFSKTLTDSTATVDLLDGNYLKMSGAAGAWIANYMLNHPTITAGETYPSFTVGKYSVISAKQNFWYYSDDFGTERKATVFIDIVQCDGAVPLYDSIMLDDGFTYYINVINFLIVHEDGSINRYVLAPHDTSNYLQVSGSTNGNGRIVLSFHGSSYPFVDIYEVIENQINFTPIIENVLYSRGFVFQVPSVNSSLTYVGVPLNEITYSPGVWYFRDYPFTTSSAFFPDIPDKGILMGNVEARGIVTSTSLNPNPTTRIFSYSQINQTYVLCYCDTNDRSFNNLNEKKQITYNQSFRSGDTINHNNYNTFYNSAFSPIYNNTDYDLPDFDLNALIAQLAPEVVAGIQPTLDFSKNRLSLDINNFLEHMPDLGYEWGIGDNNYIQLWREVNPIVTTVPGGGGCNWITPTYPALNTVTKIAATYPPIPTNTFPVQFIDNAKDIFQCGWDFYNSLGLIAIIIPVAIFGILWKFTGG